MDRTLTIEETAIGGGEGRLSESPCQRWCSTSMDFDNYLVRWGLVPDGDPIATHSSDLLPVRRHGAPAMLKIARVAELAGR